MSNTDTSPEPSTSAGTAGNSAVIPISLASSTTLAAPSRNMSWA